ncbi:MAG: transcription-repair coupling factor [Clostridia bacterium]|nr:transcription-repair coupling factor [Clostridia bacterium]
MDVYLQILDELAEFEELVKSLKNKKTPIHVLGVSDSVRAHLVYSVAKKLNKGVVTVSADNESARRLYEDLRFFFGERVYFYPQTDLLFYDVEAKGQDVTRKRLEVLRHLAMDQEPCYVVTTIEALCSVTLPPEVYQKHAIELKEGDDMELDVLARSLTFLGYRREEMVEGPGQFSIRGGILDVYPVDGTTPHPIRVEFFDTEVDSIRLFDMESQRTVERCTEVAIYPSRELLPEEEPRQGLIAALSKRASKMEQNEQRSRLERDVERLKEGQLFPSLDKYIPLLYGKELPTLLDYLDEEIVFWEEPARISEQMKQSEIRRQEEICDLAERGVLLDAKGVYALPYKGAISALSKRTVVGMSGISHGTPELRPQVTHTLTSKSLNGFQGKLEFLCDALRHYQQNIYRTVILAGSSVRAENLLRQLTDEGFGCSYQETLTQLPNPGGIVITKGSIGRGFEYPLSGVAIIGDREIFGGEKKKRRKRAVPQGDKITSFTQLNPGDYIVHQNHGIGLYTGIEQLFVDGVRKDYLKIQYRGTDILYVPTDQLDLVFKHTAKEGSRIKLNKLGGIEWGRTKERVKAAASDMAKKLIALYAQRTKIDGIAFGKDTEWQRDFEAAFPYEETGDQLRSIAEVKADMESPHPMDRLLCGDVGYGKTEVAMRAAFKAVMSGYQVAYLVPTTILASQHYNNFKQRMMAYPMRVEMLSRFTPPSVQKEVLRGLKTGEVDVVIGTHKLLGKTVEFHKLGLLVIDEEQRFGVAHKEKLKELRKEVDVLTLSATPIPRTLHMSLSGIRDMSVLNEPPGERYPVATYVLEYDENIVREAIQKELARGGQVYYLFNRVEGIYKIANRIAEMVPEARVAVAHGKMNERELEEIMMAVDQGEVDVLVCTTIIETGLDIANVNTIIIENADRLGLAQLYQLRGRVGRSNRLAYAYLTFRRNKMLTEEAEKRLLAIKEFTEFGSGFKIAMRDLEIRGTGNLIGAEQSGHLEAVGYEMYCTLLEQAVREEQGKEGIKKTETQIDLPVSAYISDSYITSHSQRIGAYKRIAAINGQEALYDAYDEIEDRYGTVPGEVENLMEVALIKNLAQQCGIAEVIGSSSQVVFRFDTENMPDMGLLIAEINRRPKELFLPNPNNPKLHFKIEKPAQGKEKAYLSAVREVVELFVPQEEDCERTVNNEDVEKKV